MSELDILGALQATATPSDGRCVIQRWLDDVPDETSGKAELVEVILERDRSAPTYRPIPTVATILRRLGFSTSENSVGNHRAKRCRCYG